MAAALLQVLPDLAAYALPTGTVKTTCVLTGLLEADALDSILEAEQARRIHPAAAQSQTSSSGSEFSSTP